MLAGANQKLELLRYMKHQNMVNTDRTRVGRDEGILKSKTGASRVICPLCHSSYLTSIYVRVRTHTHNHDNKKQKWVPIGKFCPNCYGIFLDIELVEEQVAEFMH